mgnify:CR=1 FL=1
MTNVSKLLILFIFLLGVKCAGGQEVGRCDKLQKRFKNFCKFQNNKHISHKKITEVLSIIECHYDVADTVYKQYCRCLLNRIKNEYSIIDDSRKKWARSAEVIFIVGMCHYYLTDYPKAIIWYSRCVKTAKADSPILGTKLYCSFGVSLLKEQRYSEAMEFLEKCEPRTTEIDALINISRTASINENQQKSFKGNIGKTDTAKYYDLADTSFWVGKTYILNNVVFNLSGGRNNLVHTPEQLDSLAAFLMKNSRLIVEIGYHTDSRPIPITNDTLSLFRACSVRAILIDMGICSDRIVAVGYGSRQPRVMYERTTHVFEKATFSQCQDSYVFEKNTVLNDDYINSLNSKCEKEAAHALNRRVEMKILEIK